MVYGNCLFYAVYKYVAEGFTGRIIPHLTQESGGLKLRFHYRDANGQETRLAPRYPKRGWRALYHAFWYKGVVRKVR